MNFNELFLRHWHTEKQQNQKTCGYLSKSCLNLAQISVLKLYSRKITQPAMNGIDYNECQLKFHQVLEELKSKQSFADDTFLMKFISFLSTDG